MALADIIGRIESDAGAEARTALEAAQEHAERLLAEAKAEAERDAAGHIAAAERQALAEAETLRANARLTTRDEALTAKRALIDRVLEEAADRITSLPDAEYVALIAQGVARQARGGDIVRVARADAARLHGLPEAVAAAAGRNLGLIYDGETDALEHGAALSADRVSSEISPASMLESRRDHLVALVAGVLFGDKGEG
ncbi:MAG: hypothetical protein JXP72_07835 [Coriobacteriia bacterium]|nr:hypothetical protein [Coriobacteriia bacterium]